MNLLVIPVEWVYIDFVLPFAESTLDILTKTQVFLPYLENSKQYTV